MINRVVMVGRLTKDPEMRTTTTGKNVVSFSIAVQKRTKPQDPNEPDAFFFRVTAWGQTADYVSNYLGKGRLVAVDGRLEIRKFTDSQGHQRETVEIVADNVSGLDKPKDDAGQSQSGAKTNSEAAYDPFADE